MNGYYIGVDGGGTKTTAALCDGEGSIIGLGTAGGSNPGDVGFEAAVHSLCAALDFLPSEKNMTCAVYAGIAGILTYPCAADKFKLLFPTGVKVEIGSDAMNVLECGLTGGDGCCVISGTGSVCFASVGGKLSRIGGWGYLLDSGGSGYSIGRDCAESILRAHDGRDCGTMLTAIYRSSFGIDVWDDLPALYGGGKAKLASLAPLVFQAAQVGDERAISILEKNAYALAEYINTASKYFSGDGSFKAVLSGGVFLNGDIMMPLIKQRLTCNAALMMIPAPPVFGAVSLAMSMDGRKATDEVRARFVSDFNTITS